MQERQLQFRVGLFVLVAICVGAALILQFSELKQFWVETYPLAIHFPEAPGLLAGSPVKQNGITIGSVQEIVMDEEAGGVLVIVEIREDHQLRSDARPQVSQSLFGDSRIDFSAGKSKQFVPPKSRIEGIAAVDPMEVVQRLESTVGGTLESFEATSREWQQVGRNINDLVDTNRGNLDDVIERTAIALENFNRTMEVATTTFAEAGATLKTASQTLAGANELLADPQLQEDLRKTAATLPKIAVEAEQTISAARASFQQVSHNLEIIQQATMPLAQESDVIVRKLSGSLIQLESLLKELNQFSQVINSKDGSLQRFASDPELYRNLNRSAASLSVLLHNLGPMLEDLSVFSDKVARHPELLGVSGVINGSTGIKDSREVRPANLNVPSRQ